MTVCHGIITCVGNWDLLPPIAVLSAAAVFFAARWRAWAIAGYAASLLLLLPISRAVQEAALFPLIVAESFKYGFETSPSAIPTLLLIIATFVAAAYAPRLKERDPVLFTRIVVGAGIALLVVFSALLWRENRMEMAWAAQGMMK